MADQLLFESSNDSQITSEPFISRQVVYVIDQNNGNYSGQIQLDTSSLSNSGKYGSYSEAYLQCPLVLTLRGNATGAVNPFNVDAPFAVGLKNGFHHLIHSVSVEYNNTNVVQLTPYTNFEVSYKMMTSFSKDDVKKIGPTIGFYPDSSTSYDYVATNANMANVRKGKGVLNNRNATTLTATTAVTLTNTSGGPVAQGGFPLVAVNDTAVYGANSGMTPTASTSGVAGPVTTWANYQVTKPNEGFIARQETTSFQFAAPSTSFMSQASGGSIGKDYYERDGTDHFWYILATIRLKDMHDFFDKMPLVKGAYLRFIINVNTCRHTLSFDKITGPPATVNMSQSSATITASGSSPILVASGEANQGMAPIIGNILLAAENVYTADVALDIGRSSLNTQKTGYPWGSQTRLYVPIYTMNPVSEEQYLSLNRTKKIVYRDIYQYRTDVDANLTFNALLTNGIPNPKTVICIPFIRGTANSLGAGANAIPTDPFLSPFASEPATTSPLIAFKDFNIQLAGVNMFVQNELYDFEQFQNELSSQNAINGGLVDGLTSGLISKTDFQHMYRYYICDVSRRLAAEDAVPKSVQIIGKSECALPISIFTFIEYERTVTISLETGQLMS